MAARLDPAHRQAIADSIRTKAGTASCRGIATEHGVSTDTVRRIAKDIGLPDAFAREKTKNATRARVADLAARRAGLATKMLDLAERIAERVTESYTVIIATKEDVYREQLDEPPLGDVRQGMTAVGIALDKHMALIRFDTKDTGNEAARSLVDALVATFGNPDQPTPDGGDIDDGYPVPLPTQAEIAAAGQPGDDDG
ncbi:hypothetical protein AB0B88_15925 [Micromonospora haikouensis]|uniref:hypothetical protein n=1 Tax=Actinomycetes TaxID=1760 RepID=UPI0033DD8437